jgi:outer membrane protein assembly factor BamB
MNHNFPSVLLTTLLTGLPVLAQVPAEKGDWPQWRGPNADGVSTESGLLQDWPESGPPVLWQVDTAGVGYSSLAIQDGRLFTLGDLNGVEHILCFDIRNGNTIWKKQPGNLAEQLTEKVASEFERMDGNQDGRIEESEALARFGWNFNNYDQPVDGKRQQIAETRVDALLKLADTNSDGRLDYSEGSSLFRDTLGRMDQEDSQADAQALAANRTAGLFARLDADSNRILTREEVRNTELDRQLGRFDQRDQDTDQGDQQLTEDEVKQGFLKFESGRDGIISRDELVAWYLREDALGDGELSVEELQAAFGGYRNGMGDGPRGTPTVDGDRLYVEGGNGDVACMDAATGKTHWHINLKTEFGGRLPGWGYSESPLVVDNMLIVTPGGNQGTLLALDKMTGEVIWQSDGITESAHYSTPVLATLGGVQQLVQFGNQSVFGVALRDGRPLWSYKTAANGTANCCSPVVDGDFVFASSAYGTGGGLVKVTPAGDHQQATEVYFENRLQCHHGGIVLIGDYMYTCGNGPLTCVNFRTGEIAWQARSVGKGSVVAADGRLYVLSEKQQVALVEITPEEYREHGQFEIEGHGRPSWAHPVVAGGVLYIRDQQSLTAWSVRAK